MPGKTSYYSRVKALIEFVSGPATPRSLEDLIAQVKTKSPPNFVYHRWDSDAEEYVAICSENAIRRTTALCSELELLQVDPVELTSEGKRAGDPGSFDDVMRARVAALLEASGTSVQEISKECGELLATGGGKLPTAANLHEVIFGSALDGGLGEDRFRLLLRLLNDCGGLRLSRQHIYLPNQV